jgi:hypothetical protein
MAIKYVWREVTPFASVKGLTAQVVGEEIQKIKDDHGGDLRPRYIWEAAKAPRHRLHKAFTNWELQAAAEAHWDSVARKLTGSIRILSDSERPDVPSGPAFISINDKSGTSYKTIGEVLDSEALQAIALSAALRDLQAFERRYGMFEEICDLIREARKLAEKRRARSRKSDDDDKRPSA